MSTNDTYIKVTKLVAEQLSLDAKELNVHTLFSDLNIDELDHIEIIMRTEEMFTVEITDNDADSIKGINDLVICVDKLLEKQP